NLRRASSRRAMTSKNLANQLSRFAFFLLRGSKLFSGFLGLRAGLLILLPAEAADHAESHQNPQHEAGDERRPLFAFHPAPRFLTTCPERGRLAISGVYWGNRAAWAGP